MIINQTCKRCKQEMPTSTFELCSACVFGKLSNLQRVGRNGDRIPYTKYVCDNCGHMPHTADCFRA